MKVNVVALRLGRFLANVRMQQRAGHHIITYISSKTAILEGQEHSAARNMQVWPYTTLEVLSLQ